MVTSPYRLFISVESYHYMHLEIQAIPPASRRLHEASALKVKISYFKDKVARFIKI